MHKNFKKSVFLTNFFNILYFFDIKFPFCNQNISFINKCNHSSFQNGSTFDLIMSSYQYTAQNMKIVVQKTSVFVKNALFREKWPFLLLFLKRLGSQFLRDQDQEIWQMISKLHIFQPTLIRFIPCVTAKTLPEPFWQMLNMKFWSFVKNKK